MAPQYSRRMKLFTSVFGFTALALAIAGSVLTERSEAAEPGILKLWPGEIPGPAAKASGPETDLTKPEDKLIAGRRIIKLGNVSAPELHVFLPGQEKANGGAVVICPGGGFSILAWDLEGTEAAEWLNGLGFAAAVLKYRVPTRPHGEALNAEGTAPLVAAGPLMDAQRAMSLLRARAAEWSLDPQRIGMLGFSAGGATAALAALNGRSRAYPRIDAADDQPCAVNFALLIYPAYLAEKSTGALQAHLRVDKDSPPTFLAMAQDDRIGIENCTALFNALSRANVPAEAHLFTRGGHGFGLRPTAEPATQWPRLAAEWLHQLGFDKPLASRPATLPK